nr:immunoglobulin heavy chain junction region [Mus musculus]
CAYGSWWYFDVW